MIKVDKETTMISGTVPTILTDVTTVIRAAKTALAETLSEDEAGRLINVAIDMSKATDKELETMGQEALKDLMNKFFGKEGK
ncbi:MAG: hypothetical protein R3Y47_02020 [Lachnospiraceae bacterium]